MDPNWFYYYLITGAVLWNIAFPFLFKKKTRTSEFFLLATYMVGNIVCAFLWIFILLSFIVKSTSKISIDSSPYTPKEYLPPAPSKKTDPHYVYNKKKQKIKIS